MEPCAHTEGGLRARVLTSYSDWWGEPLFGVASGSYHAYGGPGGDYFRMGVGEVVFELSRACCVQ
jgi:hypothetical protein